MTELFALSIAVLGFLLWWEKRDRATERNEWTAERRELVNRVQRPELLPVEKFTPTPTYIAPDDDQAFADYDEARRNGEAV